MNAMTTHKQKKIGRKQKPIASVTIPPYNPWDMGATGPANRHGLEQEDAATIDPDTGKAHNPNGVKKMRRVDMLEHWHRHGTISTAGYTAACALRDAFERTQLSPGTSFEQVRVDSSPKPDHAVTIQIKGLSLFHHVNRHVIAADQPLVHHCVLSKGTPASLRIRGVRVFHGANYPAGLRELAAALDRLARAMEK